MPYEFHLFYFSVQQLIPNLPVAVPIPSTSASGVTSYIIYQPITKNASLQQQSIVTPSQVSFKGTPQVVTTSMDSNQNSLAPSTISPQSPEKKVEKTVQPQVSFFFFCLRYEWKQILTQNNLKVNGKIPDLFLLQQLLQLIPNIVISKDAIF